MPHAQESVEEQEPDQVLEIRKNHIHVIFGGTTVVQTSPPNRETARLRGTFPLSAHGPVPLDACSPLRVRCVSAPDGGCLAYVLRTGFETSQGKLMRTILFSSERVTANSKETFFFIACLLAFAVSASVYVFNKGALLHVRRCIVCERAHDLFSSCAIAQVWRRDGASTSCSSSVL
jgi:cation-transporting ATPase 13A1